MKPRSPRPVTVMLVDDSAVIRQRIAAQLAELPNVRVVAEAETALQGIILFGEQRPDVVVLDLQLEASNGLDLLRRIKLSSPQCVVIVLTNAFAVAIDQASRRAGADHFLHKATQFEQLNDIIENLARLEPAQPSRLID
jgi:two-component system chemotaxis response regulator CheY